MSEESIAIIDDDGERAELIANHLEFEGFLPRRAECVVRGLASIRQSPPSAILIASKLKWLNGRDFLWLKKQVGELVDIPTIIYGLKEGESYEAFREGCEDALTDPIDLTALVMRIRVALRRNFKHGVKGSFAHIPLLDLLQMIVASRLSGQLDIDNSSIRGLLHFQRGQLIRAWSDDCEGEEAFMLLIRSGRSGGDFIYASQNNEQIERNVSKPTDHLLLEIANSLDESAS